MANVLLAEDDDQVRVLAESYLEEQGHDVLSAGTAAGALALLDKTAQVDVLFTNVDLKGEIAAGIELAHEAARRKPNLKVALHHRTQSDRRHEGTFCQELGLSAEALYRRAIAGDAVRAFPHQPAAAAPAGERLVYSARSDCRHAE
jgi:CheY-like chemotaxis protein